MMANYKLFLLFIVCFVQSNSTRIKLTMPHSNKFYKLPRFWTNTGFCPLGQIASKPIAHYLLSNDVRTNMELLAALPNEGISNIRIHWLLELVRFLIFNRQRPEFDFTDLDQFLDSMVRAKLSVGFEMMGNPNGIFNKRKDSNSYLWEFLVFSIIRRYKIRYGLDVVSKWRFETWNEPDLKTYNLLNFTVTDYLEYIKSVRKGLDAAGRTANNFHFDLSGPAGLFKNRRHHPLCWAALEECNNSSNCAFDRITFHRKGNGQSSSEILSNGLELVKDIFEKYPNLKGMTLSNDEADPIAGWSTPRPFQSDVRYATTLVATVLQHWSARLNTFEFRNLDSISHDNAFLSYHPCEFSQRTLLARFQMNETRPPHTQFIQKPVFAAMGLMGNLAEYAEDIQIVKDLNLCYMITRSHPDSPLYSAIVLLSNSPTRRTMFSLDVTLPQLKYGQSYAYIVEAIETDLSDPVKIWQYYGAPAYPNETVRMEMRNSQGPEVMHSKLLLRGNSLIRLKLSLRTPWVALLRICSSENRPPLQPNNLRIREVNAKEVIIIWSERFAPGRCLKTYQVYFQVQNSSEWLLITQNRHVPFLSFQFQPRDAEVRGKYKIRGIDIFERFGEFSKIKNFP